MQVEIRKIVYPGRSLGFQAGQAVFTDSGLPGEVVEVEPLAEKKNHIEARTVRILRSSPHRVKSRCEHYRACSPYQTIDYDYQLEIKKAQIREIFGHELKLELENFELTPSPSVWGYRNKVRLRVLWKEGTASLAYHEPGLRDEFITADGCLLLGERMNVLLRELSRALSENKCYALEDIELKQSRSDPAPLVGLYLRSPAEQKELASIYSELKTRFPGLGVAGFLKSRNSSRRLFAWGRNSIRETVAGRVFWIGPRSFFQVNIGQLENVVKEIVHRLSLTGSERIADLYCGVGTFGIILASQAAEVYGVESEPENIMFLKRNLRDNRIGNFSVCEGASEDWANELIDRGLDVVLLDPPRKGLHERLCLELLRKPAARAVYLSCNPATLARDLKRLLAAYDLRCVRGYDFFPHTPHIEILAILDRIGGRRP